MVLATASCRGVKMAVCTALTGGITLWALTSSSAQDTQRPSPVIVVAEVQRSTNQRDLALQRYERGVDAAKGGDFQRAIQFFSLALAMSRTLAPDEVGQLYQARSDAYAKTGAFDAALADAGSGIKAASNRILRSFLYALRGRIYLEMNSYDKAEIELNSSIALNAISPLSYETRAYIRYREHNLKGAAEDYEAALLLNPHLQRAKNNLSEIKRQLTDASAADAQQAEAPHPDNLAKPGVDPPP